MTEDVCRSCGAVTRAGECRACEDAVSRAFEEAVDRACGGGPVQDEEDP